MRFATKVLLLQVATVVAVVAVCTAVFVALGVQQLRAEAETAAVSIARTVAEDPQVRAEVTAAAADDSAPDPRALRDGPLQRLAVAVAQRTGTLFVVIADDNGIRLAHPDPSLLGRPLSTDWHDVLAGNEVVTWERGTLGFSARAKVPVFALETEVPVGEVSVGFEPASVFDDLPTLLLGVAGAAGAALVLGALATVLLRRRWERLTLGLQPEELITLVQHQAAVLDGVGDGVIQLDEAGVVRVCNEAAARVLELTDPVGRHLDELGLPPAAVAAVRDGTARDGVVVGSRVVYVDAQPVRRGDRALGDVLVVRDRTDLVALTARLETVRAMTGALRVQRHEFANRLHVAAGLIGAGRADDARAFLDEQLARGAVDYPVQGIDLLGDDFLRAFIGAKALEAGERGVALRVADDTLLLHDVGAAEDVAAVLGNLVDNAIDAAVAGDPAQPATVEIGCYGDGDDLVLTVSDSGAGVPDHVDVFARRERDDTVDRVRGWGVGLPLSRELARRTGGDLWLIDRGSDGTGAVFGARLCGVVHHPDRKASSP